MFFYEIIQMHKGIWPLALPMCIEASKVFRSVRVVKSIRLSKLCLFKRYIVVMIFLLRTFKLVPRILVKFGCMVHFLSFRSFGH